MVAFAQDIQPPENPFAAGMPVPAPAQPPPRRQKPENFVQTGNELPDTLLGHGNPTGEMATADRPLTFWTKPGVPLPVKIAREIARDQAEGGSNERISRAFQLWSEHTSKGGDFSDFKLPPELADLQDIGELEGACSILPGTPFEDLNISRATDVDIGYRHGVSQPQKQRGAGFYDDGENPTIVLGEALARGDLPGGAKDPLTVLACRGGVTNEARETSAKMELEHQQLSQVWSEETDARPDDPRLQKMIDVFQKEIWNAKREAREAPEGSFEENFEPRAKKTREILPKKIAALKAELAAERDHPELAKAAQEQTEKDVMAGEAPLTGQKVSDAPPALEDLARQHGMSSDDPRFEAVVRRYKLQLEKNKGDEKSAISDTKWQLKLEDNGDELNSFFGTDCAAMARARRELKLEENQPLLSREERQLREEMRAKELMKGWEQRRQDRADGKEQPPVIEAAAGGAAPAAAPATVDGAVSESNPFGAPMALQRLAVENGLSPMDPTMIQMVQIFQEKLATQEEGPNARQKAIDETKLGVTMRAEAGDTELDNYFGGWATSRAQAQRELAATPGYKDLPEYEQASKEGQRFNELKDQVWERHKERMANTVPLVSEKGQKVDAPEATVDWYLMNGYRRA